MAETGPITSESAGLSPNDEPRDKKMGEDELKSIIKREQDSALGIEGGRLSWERRKELEYYEGYMLDLDNVEGRSSIVMRSVLETVEWILPALLRIFFTGNQVAQYEPMREQDEAGAEQATDYCDYILQRDNQGFLIFYDWFKTALIQKVGWIKVWWDTEDYVETNDYAGLSEEEYQALTSAPNVKIVEERSYPAPAPSVFDEDAPQTSPGQLHDLTLRSHRAEGRVHIEGVAPEEVLTSRRAKGVEYLPFVCHRRQRTVSDLIQDGYQEEQAYRLQGYDEQEYNTERIVRYEKEDDFPYQTERTDAAMRVIWVEENYIRVDWDGDGVAELRKVVTAGNAREILIRKDGTLDNEEIPEVALIPITPIRMPYKLTGMSVAEIVMDLQRIRSVLMRQMLDNLYLTNAPRYAIEEGAATENTYGDLLTVRPGGLVRTQKNAGLMPLEVPFVAEKALTVLQYIDTVAEQRTGIAPHNQSLDSNIINQSSSGVQEHLLQQQAAQRVELIARVFAETGVMTLMKRILGLVTRYQQTERIIRLTGKWIAMDPRQWRNSMNVSVSVGLGTGNRDQILAHLMQVLQVQAQIIAVQKGVSGPLVTAKNVYDTVSRLTENAGFKESFFTDPSQPPPPGQQPPQPPPDPDMVKAQGQLQLQQAKQQADLQADQVKAQQEFALERERASLEMQIQQKKFEHEIALEQMREQFKQQLAMRDMEHRHALAAQQAAMMPAQPAATNGGTA